MRVLITGGTGSVGRAVVDRIVRHGHQATVVGRREDLVIEGATYEHCDVTNFDELKEVMTGSEAVIHLAAIPNPFNGSSVAIFDANCRGTFHVYEAASQLKIKRVVTASSINAFGFNFGLTPFPIDYLPVDEAHPTTTTDPYSFSKQVTEDIAHYYFRRSGITGVCLRLPWVYSIDEVGEERFTRWIEPCREQADRLMGMPEPDRRVEVSSMIRRFDEYRVTRYENAEGDRRNRGMVEPPPLLAHRSNFWTYIDTRDSAQAFEKAVVADYEGSHPLFVNDSHNAVGVPSATLASLFYPEANANLRGTDTLVSIEQARSLIGFEPEYSVSRFYR